MAGAATIPSQQRLALEGVEGGLNGQGRERVAEIQRARLLAAMVEVCAERGAGDTTVAHVVARAGVSRRTFYELFSDREDCFLAAFDDGIARITSVLIPVYEQSGRWAERVRAGLVALLRLLDEDPALARLLVVESLGAGPRALERRSRVIETLAGVIDEGRDSGGSAKADGLPPMIAEGVVGAVLSVLHGRLAGESSGQLTELVNPLMSMVVLPYLGASAARKELDRPNPKVGERRPPKTHDTLRELEIRLTYRTVRVLMAVASSPGSSNRTVADGAGIADQGQISKLLARLHGLGLVENTGGNPARGEPNAWVLTAKGWDVHEAISSHAEAS